MNPVLLTAWLAIGTSGPTVDGRNIKPDWLKQAADSYDPKEYTAVVNAEHWFGNYGSVRELKTTTDEKGRTVLWARIRPNKYYLQQNSEDLRLFFSMELTHNFAKSGKTYLTGLASTDKPASLGTTEAHFSKKDTAEVFRGGEAEVSSSELKIDFSEVEKNKSIAAAVVDGIKDFFSKKDNKQEEFEMNEEQFNEMLDGQNKIAESLGSLTDAVTKLTAGDGKQEKTTETGKEEEISKTEASAEVSDEAMSKFAEGQQELLGAVSKLNENLTKALEGKFGANTDGSGVESDNEVNVL